MAFSVTPGEAARRLGALLTATEARNVADRLTDGDTVTAALRCIAPGRRPDVRLMLDALAGGGTTDHTLCVTVLRGIEGARADRTSLEPVWTMPGHIAQYGPLTTSAVHLVERARQSVTCSTFNFQRSSGLWHALRDAARRPGVHVRVYVDTQAADNGYATTPTTSALAAHLRPATVLRTRPFDGSAVRNHAKILAVDHRYLLVTSANLSWSAEHHNIEFGVRIDNPSLTEAVERALLLAEDHLYEEASPST